MSFKLQKKEPVVAILVLFSLFAYQSANTQTQRRSANRQAYKDLQKEYLKILNEEKQLEEEIKSRRQDYYNRTKEKFEDLGDKMRDMVWDILHGESPNRMPSPKDLFELLRDYGKYVGDTANDLIDLQTKANELGLRLQKANQKWAELQHSPNPVPHQPKPPKPINRDELDDAIDLWGYRELGDRYFDGRPEALSRFLSKHGEYKRGVRPELPPDNTAHPKKDSKFIDPNDNDEMDMLGYMMEGEQYFADRPGAWERFKQRHPDYEELTWDALEKSEHAEWKRRTIEGYHRRCTKAESDHQYRLKQEQENFSKAISACNSIGDRDLRAGCISSANESHAQALKSINDEWKKAKDDNYCGRDEDLSRMLDRKFKQ